MDIKRALRNAVSTGQVYIGSSQTKKSVSKGKSKLVIVSKNCPKKELAELADSSSVPVYSFDGTNVELGAACGKPFSISMLSVQSAGDSDILALRKEIMAKKSAGKKVVKKKTAPKTKKATK
jgi:large subunit ribosomal protein L30e